MSKFSWKKRIKESQQVTQYKILGKYYDRIRFGNEKWYDPIDEECEICHVKTHYFHVLGCSKEFSVCEKCSTNQMIYCECEAEIE